MMRRDLESQTDELSQQVEAAHDVLVPNENEDEFEDRNLENQIEEKRVLLQGETEAATTGKTNRRITT